MKSYKKFIASITAVSVLAAVIMSGCSFFQRKNLSTLISSQSSAKSSRTTIDTTEKKLYGYSCLDNEYVRNLYAEIDDRIDSFEVKDLCVNTILDNCQILQAVDAYKEDHPEKFWLKSSITFYTTDNCTYVNLEYNMEQEELIKAKKNFSAAVNEIVENAADNTSDYELEIYIHDYIVNNCVYDFESAKNNDPNVASNAYDAYGVIVEGKAVCEGYARAFNLLCRKFNIDCVNISGTSESTEHMWNTVLLDNNWYNVDVTWDDPDSKEEELSVFKYAFLNMSDDMFLLNHKPSKLYSEINPSEYHTDTLHCNLLVPQCSSDDYYYYYINGTELNDINDSETMSEAIALAYSQENDYFYIRISSELDFDYTYDSLIEGTLSEWIQKANFDYGLSIKPDVLVYALKEFNLIAVQLKNK